MKTIIARAALVAALLAAGVADAQDYKTYKPSESMFIVNYEIGLPIGDFRDFIDDTSWRGFSFEGRSMVRPKLSVGLGFNWNRYDQTFSLLSVSPSTGGGTLSGPVYRYADALAVKGLLHYYLREGPLRPYLGVGLGGVWTYAYAQTADLARSDNGFDFIASPELGLMWTAAHGASSLGLNLAFRYNFTTADFLSVSNAQTLNFVIGLFGAY
jgi:hypothetical protein